MEDVAVREAPGASKMDLERIPGDYQHRALTEGGAVQRYWHHSKLKLADVYVRPGADDKVVDVGCGSGVVANHLARNGAEVLGVDGNPRAIEFARATFRQPGLSYAERMLDDLALPNGHFSAAICFEVLEHLTPRQQIDVLTVVGTALQPGGRLLVTTPNYRGFWPLLEWGLDRLRLVPHLDDDQHISKLNARSLRALIAASGLEPMKVATFCTLAPFAAAVSWSAADWCFRKEIAANLPFGTLLYALAVKR